MDDGAALLKQILANPHDDVVRLVYADYLEEHGERERAEFIRVQIEYASNPCSVLSRFQSHAPSPANGPCAGCVRVSELRKREVELTLQAVGQWWMSEVPQKWMVKFDRDRMPYDRPTLYYARGFACRASCPAADWLKHADAIRERHPVTRVVLTTMPTAHVPEVNATRKWNKPLEWGADVMWTWEAEWPGIAFELPANHPLNEGMVAWWAPAPL